MEIISQWSQNIPVNYSYLCPGVALGSTLYPNESLGMDMNNKKFLAIVVPLGS